MKTPCQRQTIKQMSTHFVVLDQTNGLSQLFLIVFASVYLRAMRRQKRTHPLKPRIRFANREPRICTNYRKYKQDFDAPSTISEAHSTCIVQVLRLANCDAEYPEGHRRWWRQTAMEHQAPTICIRHHLLNTLDHELQGYASTTTSPDAGSEASAAMHTPYQIFAFHNQGSWRFYLRGSSIAGLEIV